MLVDVVLMRRDGIKLSEAELRAARPVRGYLRLETLPWRSFWTPDVAHVLTTFAGLSMWPRASGSPEDGSLLPPLRNAIVRSLRAGQMVVVGLEAFGSPTRANERPQAWWCRQLLAAELEDAGQADVRAGGADMPLPTLP